MTAWRASSTAMLLVVMVAAFAVTPFEALSVSWRLTASYVLAPLIGWSLAFFGSGLAEVVGLAAKGAADTALRILGTLVLFSMCALLVSKWLE